MSFDNPGTEAVAAPKGQGGGDGGRRPNILVVLTDDQRDRGTMGLMNKTTRLFKDGGVRFSRAFTTTPVCCPARASVFTGQYVHNHELFTNGEKDLPQFETVQRYLDDAGYKTGIYGKYLNAWEIEENPPHFDKWSIYKNSSAVYSETNWNDQGDIKNVIEYPTDYIGTKARRFLNNFAEKKDRKPWFLFLAPPNPHLPAKIDRIYEDTYVGRFKSNPATREKDRSDKPHYVRKRSSGRKRTRRIVKRQRRSLLSVDEMIGDLKKRLNKLDETRNTLVIFASDNGFLWAEHKMLGSLRSKANPYSESIRVPIYVRYPRKFSNFNVDDRFVSIVDIAPTILDAARLHTDPGLPMDGKSLLRRTWDRKQMFMEFYPTRKSQIPLWKSIRTTKYQYVEYYHDDGDIAFREYYDMKKDPWQLENLFKDGKPGNDPEKKPLERKIKRLRDCVANECP
jgi:arylsulfatase A-like enzyme